MIVIVDDRALVQSAYTTQFDREGYPASGFSGEMFRHWVAGISKGESDGITACLICDQALSHLDEDGLATLRERIEAPMIVLCDRTALDDTLRWFAAGYDDVVRKPVHFRELLARIAAIRRRKALVPVALRPADQGRLRVFDDGRDPVVDGQTLPLPRRERRVLEHLASIGERRATKAQLYEAIYGMFGDDVEETVVESHVSKLRKKLRTALDYDPIDSKRFLGYRLRLEAPSTAPVLEQA